MRSAESVLRELNARLDLPVRRRALLLRELRADFEDLVATLVSEGLSPEAAHARALEMLAPTADDAGALSTVHRSLYARLVSPLRPAYVDVVERAGIGAMAALAVLAPVLATARSSRLSWPTVVTLGCVALLLVAHLSWQAFRIVVRADADAASLARAGVVQAGIVALTLAAGTFAVATEAYRAAGALQAQGGVETSAVTAAVMTCTDAAAVALGLTILGVFGAFALLQWHVAARAVERELTTLLGPVFSFGKE